MSSNTPIAVIGIACRYPDARNPRQLWENVLSRRRQFRRLPNQRLPLNDYYSPDSTAADKTYGYRAALIDGFDFDWASRRIPFSTFKATDIVHWLALEIADKAFADAGYTRENVPHERTGVIVGNTLTGEQTRTSTIRLRWPYVRRAFRAACRLRGLPREQIMEVETAFETIFKSVFPSINEDSLAGGLSNTIAGRICNFFDLRKGGYTIDGACSSSLLAVATGATGLANGDLDLALAGGVDISLDPFELVGFAKTNALTKKDMTVYDRRGSGFIPGEGCGFTVLKRLEDAERDNDYIYAVLHGWGISSDGGGTGITAPNAKGQARALENAYADAPYTIGTLKFIEGHGTGTTVGDQVELEGVSMVMDNCVGALKRTCGMTSLKSIIGHTKAASGIGGFIKTVMAVNRRVLPPIAGCRDPHPVFDTKAGCLYPILQGEICNKSESLRAGVSAMGFGGINCHITLESGHAPSLLLKPAIEERSLLISNQDTEVFVLSGDSVAELEKRAKDLLDVSKGMSIAELADLAAKTAQDADLKNNIRAAVIAGEPDELSRQLRQLVLMIKEKFPDTGGMSCDPDRTILLGNEIKQPRIGLLFPGQGSQNLNMGRMLVERFPWAGDMADQAGQWLGEKGSDLIYRPIDRAVSPEEVDTWFDLLSQTENAQPAICFASVLWNRFLRKLGVNPVAVGGHSLGELTAFHAAGAFDVPDLIRLAAIRGRAMALPGDQAGAMVSLQCSRNQAESILKKVAGYIVLANINGPNQIILSGERAAVENAIQIAADKGIKTYRLKVSNAFHSRLAAGAADVLAVEKTLDKILSELKVKLFSSVSGQEISPGLALNNHFANQVLAQVDFAGMITSMAEVCDLFLEVGPGRALTGLTNKITGKDGPVCLPVESKPLHDRDLNIVLGELFIRKVDIHWETIYGKRLIRPFTRPQEKLFVKNSCEQPFKDPVEVPLPLETSSAGMIDSMITGLVGLPCNEIASYMRSRGPFLAQVIRADMKYTVPSEVLKKIPQARMPEIKAEDSKYEISVKSILYQIIHDATGFPVETLSPDSRLLDDLNLDSIKAGDVISKCAEQCGIAGQIDPAESANATLREIMDAIIKLDPTVAQGTSEIEPPAAGPSIDTRKNAEALLLAQVEKITGFPRNSLGLEMRLLDDLNLDSIKAGDLIARTAKKLNIEGDVESFDLADASLAEILDKFTEFTDKKSPKEQHGEEPAFLEIVLDQTSRITGYPRETLDADSLIEKDLNIGQDMLKTLLQRVAALKEIEIHIDLEPFRERSLRQLAVILERITSCQKPIIAGPEKAETWVREFAVDLVEQESPPFPEWWGNRREDDRHNAGSLIISDQETALIAESLHDGLYRRGASVRTATYKDARNKGLAGDASYSLIIAIFPQTPATDSDAATLQNIIERLAILSSIPPASEAPRRRTTIAYIQFGGGYFGAHEKFSHLNQCCGVALAATIHLERTDLRVRVLDFSPAIEVKKIAEKIIEEISAPEPYIAAGFDYKLRRRIARSRLLQPAAYNAGQLTWSSKDVILVTGGAKGITASCALGLARATGVRTALIGRSPHPDIKPDTSTNNDISITLKKYTDRGLVARYYSCDVADRKSVAAIVGRIQEEMGPVTGVIHGAGLNIPRLAGRTTVENTLAEVSPKLLGALNLISALKNTPPKIIVGLTSIIGITGMAGNGWYGFSNEALDIVLRRFGADYPETRTQSIAYSVWGEEGMGVRLGSVDGLKKMGIDAIPTREGVNRFVNLFLNDPGDHQVIVTARVSSMDTWNFEAPAPPEKARYLEEPVMVVPGVESVFKARLTLEQDPYLKDHLFNGSYLMPAVFGLEAMAQAVAHATGERDFSRVRIKNIKFERPITVDPEIGTEIVIRAEVEEQKHDSTTRVIHAAVAKSSSGIKADYFSATFELGLTDKPPRHEITIPDSPLAVQPAPDLYREDLLFQGPLFQRIEQILFIEAAGDNAEHASFKTMIADHATAAETAFPDPGHRYLFLGDPFFRDSLLQSAFLLVPKARSLPVYIENLDIYPCVDKRPAIISATAQLEHFKGREIKDRVIAVDKNGIVIEKLDGYFLRMMKYLDEYPSAADLIHPDERDNGIVKQALHNLSNVDFDMPSVLLRHIPGLHELSREERHQKELPMMQDTVRLATEAVSDIPRDFEIKWLDSGKPVIVGLEKHNIDISLSHDDRLCICSAGTGPQGCDIAPITHRTRQEWTALLGAKRDNLFDELLDSLDSLDQAGTRIWAALEALRKATAESCDALKILHKEQDTVIFQCMVGKGPAVVLTLPFDLTWGPERILALVVQKSAKQEAAPADSEANKYKGYEDIFDKHHFKIIQGGPQGQGIFIHRFPVGFKPNAQLSRTIYFSNYVSWVGEVREASVWPVLGKIVGQYSTGEWGSITNYSYLQILGEATAHNLIEVRMWASGNGGPANSTMDLTFDFRKILQDGSYERLAKCEQQTTWVRILDQGAVRPEPYPDYYWDVVKDMLPHYDAPNTFDALPEPLAGLTEKTENEVEQYRTPPGPKVRPLLFEHTIETSLDSSNLVGNIYFANYYAWQGQTRDRYFFNLIPECFRGIGEQGELICLETRVDHLREAMPFDRIIVTMALKVLKSSSAVFHFEYFRLDPDGTKTKLAFGEQNAVWVVRNNKGKPEAEPFPNKVRDAFESAIRKCGKR